MKKLDVLANDLFINMLRSSYACCLMVSEENETIISVDAAKQVRKKTKTTNNFISNEMKFCIFTAPENARPYSF